MANKRVLQTLIDEQSEQDLAVVMDHYRLLDAAQAVRLSLAELARIINEQSRFLTPTWGSPLEDMLDENPAASKE